MRLRLALAQINTTVGDIAGNAAKITARIEEARRQEADVVVFPELAISGYPPEDLLLKPDFVAASTKALDEVVQRTDGIIAVIGCVHRDRDLYNAAVIACDGAACGLYKKECLPNYGVFDEQRYFTPGDTDGLFAIGAHLIGISICEDIWIPDGPPARQAVEGGAALLINISASPYHAGKGKARELMLRARATDNRAIVAYCNLVGGQDELVFDGQSLIIGADGELLARATQFEEQLLVADLDLEAVSRLRAVDPRPQPGALPIAPSLLTTVAAPRRNGERKTTTELPLAAVAEPIEEVYRALVLGTRDYVRKCGFDSVLIGLSGGIDSALTAAIAADALGSDKVTGVTMPTRFSSRGSIEDSRELAANLGIEFREMSIDALMQSYLDALQPFFRDTPPGLAEENIQSRIRGNILMAMSNKWGSLVLTTGNKSEIAVGYSTLYGDTAGGYAVIKDVPKTLVYELCRYRNETAGRPMIPVAILVKAPSAELRPNQLDTDSLPDYALLDRVLQSYVEENSPEEELIAEGLDPEVVRRVINLIDRSEYKRRQSPIGLKITPRAFGRDWRLPIAHRYKR